MGKQGTNGPVHSIHVDLCLNVYIGGEFTHVDGIHTGPVAKYSYMDRSWKALQPNSTFEHMHSPLNDANFTSEGTVSAISSNCFHFAICECDVFFGGNFAMYDSSGTATVSLAKYNAKEGKTEALSPQAWTVEDTFINALYKKNLGVTEATSYLWVGGRNLGEDTYFGRINLQDNSWKPFPEVNDEVRAFEYESVTIGLTDKLFVGGDFDFTNNGVNCRFLCRFDHSSLDWTEVSSEVEGPIYSLQKDGSSLYIAGNFSYGVKKVEDGSVSTIHGLQESRIPKNQLISKIDVCERLDLGCKGGSTAFAGDGYTRFFNSRKGTFEPFGNVIDGQVSVIQSSFQFRSSSNILKPTFTLALMMLVFLLLT